MPLDIATPRRTGPEITRAEIAKVVIDLEHRAIEVEYWLGYIEGAAFVKVERRRQRIDGPAFAAAAGEPDAELAAGAPNVYAAVKRALYKRLMAAEGITGNVI